MNSDGFFAFYGTLRKDMENYVLYARGMHFLKSVKLSGFRLYSLGDYPYAVPADGSKIVSADLFRITDPHVALSIHNMEIEAGYYYDEILIDERYYGIYLFECPNPGDEEIKSGDWVQYIRQIGF